jgi:excisionase family DNA binding protein
MRVREAAGYLCIGQKALRQLVASGQLAFIQLRPGNSPLLLDIRDLDKFVDHNKNQKGD